MYLGLDRAVVVGCLVIHLHLYLLGLVQGAVPGQALVQLLVPLVATNIRQACIFATNFTFWSFGNIVCNLVCLKIE